MQSNKKPGKILFWLSVISFFISSATILFMPLGSFEPDGNILLAYLLAIAFWLFFALGLLFVFLLSRHRFKDIRFARKGGIGLLRFFQSLPAGVFDILLIIGFVTLIVSLFFIRTLPGIITLAGTFITVFSLEMHCMLNGRNYTWLYM